MLRQRLRSMIDFIVAIRATEETIMGKEKPGAKGQFAAAGPVVIMEAFLLSLSTERQN